MAGAGDARLARSNECRERLESGLGYKLKNVP